jgi:hypothetical protein
MEQKDGCFTCFNVRQYSQGWFKCVHPLAPKNMKNCTTPPNETDFFPKHMLHGCIYYNHEYIKLELIPITTEDLNLL